MSTPQKGLGKGLGALIPGAGGAAEAHESGQGSGQGTGMMRVPIREIAPNPRQPRGHMSPETLVELATSIREHGILQPLIITRSRPTDPTPFFLIAGERRWRAAQLAGLESVPALLKEATPQQLLELALVENIQRADLNALEEAAAYQALIEEFSLSQHQVADRVGKSRVAVANLLRLLRLPERVKALLAEGALSEGHARALLGLPADELMVEMAGQVVARELSVRQTEELVRRVAAANEAAPDEEPEAEDNPYVVQTRQLEATFRSVLGTKVNLTRGKRGGRLVVHFYSDEELQSIYEHIVGAA